MLWRASGLGSGQFRELPEPTPTKTESRGFVRFTPARFVADGLRENHYASFDPTAGSTRASGLRVQCAASPSALLITPDLIYSPTARFYSLVSMSRKCRPRSDLYIAAQREPRVRDIRYCRKGRRTCDLRLSLSSSSNGYTRRSDR